LEKRKVAIVLQEVFKGQIIGAINTYIRVVNESDKLNEVGNGRINNEWYSYLEEEGDTFVAILNIDGKEEKFHFKKSEWKTLNVNPLANPQLVQLRKKIGT
jgi:hypothetical protein